MIRLHARTLSHPARKVNHLCPGAGRAYGDEMEPGSRNDTRQQAALADLARLSREGDALGGLTGRAGAHFGAADAPAGDRIELWGRRIGRTLSAVAFVGLCVYLYVTYVR
jgi:hypothetical protein